MALPEVCEKFQRESPLLGLRFSRAYTELIDAWLVGLYDEVFGSTPGVALVATGGHGRSELCPASDLDLTLIHTGGVTVSDAEAFWYPLWDSGKRVGHSVRTVDEALELAKSDIPTATALLSCRPIAGSTDLAAALARKAASQWSSSPKRSLTVLLDSVELRQRTAGEVPFDLEPDLKEGRGGLRDVHALEWALAADPSLEIARRSDLEAAYETLLAARIELHRVTSRTGDRLLLQEQDEVAARLGAENADQLMAQVAMAGRRIAWSADEAWADVREQLSAGMFRRSRKPREVGPGIDLVAGRVELRDGPGATGGSMVDLALAAGRERVRMSRQSLEWLRDAPAVADPWPVATREDFIALLLLGHDAIDVIETLDIAELWCRLIPEWEPNRSRPQRNAYHRFTVDRHLLECVAQAAVIAQRVGRPDLLMMGALLHDIGKGYPGDHALVGRELAATIARRMGFAHEEIETIQALVELHLVLPDVATRRDLDDPTTIRSVAARVHTAERLELLEALTEADSIATGPSAWGLWKAGLLHQLVQRVGHVIAGGDVEEVIEVSGPTPTQLALLEQGAASGELIIETEGDRISVICTDRPGLFSKVAGVLALNGLDVVEATAGTRDGLAVEDFRVTSSFGAEIPWTKVERELRRALRGRFALEPRLAERARTYKRAATSARPLEAQVRVLDEASGDATVVEVFGGDSIGLLFRLTQALADLDLDILRAKVSTMGGDVVDAFYVRDPIVGKIVDPDEINEICSALKHVLEASEPR